MSPAGWCVEAVRLEADGFWHQDGRLLLPCCSSIWAPVTLTERRGQKGWVVVVVSNPAGAGKGARRRRRCPSEVPVHQRTQHGENIRGIAGVRAVAGL